MKRKVDRVNEWSTVFNTHMFHFPMISCNHLYLASHSHNHLKQSSHPLCRVCIALMTAVSYQY